MLIRRVVACERRRLLWPSPASEPLVSRKGSRGTRTNRKRGLTRDAVARLLSRGKRLPDPEQGLIGRLFLRMVRILHRGHGAVYDISRIIAGQDALLDQHPQQR